MSERVKPRIGGLASLLQAEKQKKQQALTQESAEGTTTLSSETAQTTQGSLSTQGNNTIQSSISAQPSLSVISATLTESDTPAQGSLTAHSKLPAQGNNSALGRAPARDNVSPRRDFMKAPNSVIRNALRNGLFRGKSKQIYDFLYSKTRGAIVPRMSVQLRRAEIMEGSHVGSTHTLRDNLKHLKAVGLVGWNEKAGEQDGNEYFVYLPEEAQLPVSLDGDPVQLNCPDHPDHPGQILPRPPRAESALGAQGSSSVDTTTSGKSKTNIRQEEKFDDEALADLTLKLKEAAREITGKEVSIADRARWEELAELLVTELRIAAARTTVSNAPAFLTEHLRRRLWKKDKQTMSEEKATPEHAASSPLLLRLKPEEIKACPDCGGTGFYYPTGYEGGVAKCRHERLVKE